MTWNTTNGAASGYNGYYIPLPVGGSSTLNQIAFYSFMDVGGFN